MKTIATSIFLCRRRIPSFGSYELVLQNFHRISINTELLRIWFSSVEKQSNRGQIIELISFVNASGFNFFAVCNYPICFEIVYFSLPTRKG